MTLAIIRHHRDVTITQLCGPRRFRRLLAMAPTPANKARVIHGRALVRPGQQSGPFIEPYNVVEVADAE